MTEGTAERATSGSGRVIKLRYAGRCGCGAPLAAGSSARWDAPTRTVSCLAFVDVSDSANAAEAMGGTATPSANSVAPADNSTGLGDLPQAGTPGGAAGREYLRRKTKRDAETDALPLGLRKLARKLFDDPQHIRAWQSGERGEIAVAKVLDGLAADTIYALHDRRIPHSRANIDHIAIGPAGIYVIDAKR